MEGGNPASRVQEGLDQQDSVLGHQAKRRALQTVGDGQRGRSRLRLSRRVCSGGEEGTAEPDAQVPDVPDAHQNFQNSGMKLYSARGAKLFKKIVLERPPSEL